MIERLRQLEVFLAAVFERLALFLERSEALLLLQFVDDVRTVASILVFVIREVLLKIGLAQAQPVQAIAIGVLIDQQIGNDALGLDRAAVRRVVARGGQLDRGVSRDDVWSVLNPCRRSVCP